MTTTEPGPAPATPDELAGRIGSSAIAMLEVLCVYLGDRLGFYRALHEGGPATAPELAARSGTDPRYTREWLEQQATAGFLACDNPEAPPDERRFHLPHGYEQVLTMDCDRSHHPRHLPAILAAMERHDMVIGSRYVPGGGIVNWPLHRRWLSWFANLYAGVLLRLPVHDCTSGYRAYHRRVLESCPNLNAAADILGIDQATIYRKRKKMAVRAKTGDDAPAISPDLRS